MMTGIGECIRGKSTESLLKTITAKVGEYPAPWHAYFSHFIAAIYFLYLASSEATTVLCTRIPNPIYPGFVNIS